MSDRSTKLTRRQRLVLASFATVTLSLGGAGVVAAAGNPSSTPAKAVTHKVVTKPASPAAQTPTAKTRAAAEAEVPDANEPPEAPETDTSEEVDGVDCENGIDAKTGAECDGGPAANPQDGADDATEGPEAPEATETAAP